MFVVKEFETIISENTSQRVIGIGIKADNNIIYPSPLSNFIKQEYRGLEINSQRNAAYAITRFMNYLSSEVKTGNFPELNQGLAFLNLEHFAAYISHLSIRSREGELSESYVKQSHLYINNFYYWLKRQDILRQEFQIAFVENSNKNQWKFRNIAKTDLLKLNDIEVIYPLRDITSRYKIKDFGEGKEYLIKHFISVANKVDPLLTLPIALEIFGGLRSAEVVNLIMGSFKWEGSTLIIQVRDNQKILFGSLKNTGDVQVKRPRDQVCIGSNMLKVLYDEHLCILQRSNKINPQSIFISYKTGKPMTGKEFSRRFTKVKEIFLNDLLECGLHQDYIKLTEAPWSTHIGRGIYTNMLYKLGLTATQIAIARGDRNITSAHAYIDEKETLRVLEQALERLSIDL